MSIVKGNLRNSPKIHHPWPGSCEQKPEKHHPFCDPVLPEFAIPRTLSLSWVLLGSAERGNFLGGKNQGVAPSTSCWVERVFAPRSAPFLGLLFLGRPFARTHQAALSTPSNPSSPGHPPAHPWATRCSSGAAAWTAASYRVGLGS